jgi:hypothetical protein
MEQAQAPLKLERDVVDMFSNQTPFLFPHNSVLSLREMREERHWSKLVDRVSRLPETNEESLAFQLMMVKICGCLRCTNYKANLGCTTCSQRAVRNSKSPTNAMIHWFTKARSEVNCFLNGKEVTMTLELELAA